MTEELTPKFKLMPIYRCADCNLALGCQQFHEGYFDYNKTVAPDCPLDTYGELPQWVKDAIEDMIQCIFDIMSTNPQGYVKNCELLSKVHVLERVLSLRKPEEK